MFGISLRLRADWFVFCSPFVRLVFVLWSKPSRRTVEAHPNQSRSCSLSLSSRCASILKKTKDFYGLPWTFTDFFGLLAYTFFVIKHKIYTSLKKRSSYLRQELFSANSSFIWLPFGSASPLPRVVYTNSLLCLYSASTVYVEER